MRSLLSGLSRVVVWKCSNACNVRKISFSTLPTQREKVRLVGARGSGGRSGRHICRRRASGCGSGCGGRWLMHRSRRPEAPRRRMHHWTAGVRTSAVHYFRRLGCKHAARHEPHRRFQMRAHLGVAALVAGNVAVADMVRGGGCAESSLCRHAASCACAALGLPEAVPTPAAAPGQMLDARPSPLNDVVSLSVTPRNACAVAWVAAATWYTSAIEQLSK